MTALPTSGSFAMVDPVHVAEVGPAAAILYARLAWRARATGGEWRASRRELRSETGLSEAMLRTAVQVLRDREWITADRTSPDDPTLIWRPLDPCDQQKDDSAPPPAESTPPPLRNPPHPPAESSISSIETSKTSLPPRPLRVVEDAPEPEERPEVVALCTRLADRIEANGSKRPTITKTWLTACRLLLDRDGRTPAQVAGAIDWCQADTFWRANVLSMPTLRKQYDKLRLRALEERGQQSPVPLRRNVHADTTYDPAWERELARARGGN